MIKNLAVIGSGHIASHHIESILALGSHVKAIASRPGSEATKALAIKYRIPKIYETSEELINSLEDLEALIICTPPRVVPEILNLVEGRKIFILIEKPALCCVNSLDKFKNKEFYVGYNRRFYDTVKTFKKLTSKAEGIYHVNIVEDKIDISNKFEICETIKNNSIHYFDLLHYLFGKFQIGTVSVIPGDCGFSICAHSFSGSTIGVINILFGSPANSSLSFSNSDLYLQLKPIEVLSRYNQLQVAEPNELHKIRQYSPIWVPKTAAQKIIEDFHFKPGIYQQMNEFLHLGEDSSGEIKLATLEDALYAFTIAEDICKQIITI